MMLIRNFHGAEIVRPALVIEIWHRNRLTAVGQSLLLVAILSPFEYFRGGHVAA